MSSQRAFAAVVLVLALFAAPSHGDAPQVPNDLSNFSFSAPTSFDATSISAPALPVADLKLTLARDHALDDTVELVAVPEPSAAWLLGIGLIALTAALVLASLPMDELVDFAGIVGILLGSFVWALVVGRNKHL